MAAYDGAAAPFIDGVSSYFSVAPTVPYQDAPSVVRSMQWLESNMGAGSCVILHHNFIDWGKLYLDKSHPIVYFNNNLDEALAVARSNGFRQMYFVWWNEPFNWYSQSSVPTNFVGVQDFGRISVYVHEA